MSTKRMAIDDKSSWSMYYKNQIFYILVSLCFFTYALFHYIRYKDVEARSIFKVVPIVNKSCSAAPRLISSVKVLHNNKLYAVELSYDSCYKYSIGNKVTLLYDEKYNRFYLLNYFNIFNFRVVFITIILVLLVFLWKRVVSYLQKKRDLI